MAEIFEPIAGYDLTEVMGWVAVWVAYGIGLMTVFWSLGYAVWFVIQFFK